MKELPGSELGKQPEVAPQALIAELYRKIWPESRYGILMGRPYKVVELPGIGDASIFILVREIQFVVKHPQIAPGKTEFMIDKFGYVKDMQNYRRSIDRTLVESLLRTL